MKRLILIVLCAATLCAGGIVLLEKREPPQEPAPQAQEPAPQAQAPSAPTEPVQEKSASFDEAVTLRVLTDGGVEEVALHDYLVGVLVAEMPTDFPPEALKAQAVASRTFALRQAEARKHADADVCADPACCQGYLTDASADGLTRLTEAVKATDGLVMTYADGLIDATFFSCSGGRTEDAAAVWGGDIPYLHSVDSPGEEDAPRYTETVTVSAETFSETLRGAYPETNLSGSPKGWFGACSYTEGGGIDTIFIGGTAVNGTKLRSLFSLRSTNIAFAVTEAGEIEITTYGFGHRVGLSQYGAKAMAEAGAGFDEILTHYYDGAAVTRLLTEA